jgi:hypothetical protein
MEPVRHEHAPHVSAAWLGSHDNLKKNIGFSFPETSYEGSSFGWDPPAKRHELFDPLGRFLLIRSGGTVSRSTSPRNPGDGDPQLLEDRTSLCAYAIFRFDREEGVNVVYWCVIRLSNPRMDSRYVKCEGLMTHIFSRKKVMNCRYPRR